MMRERTKVDGRDATVVYITRNFVPVDKEDADFMKIVFDDGSPPIFCQNADPDKNVEESR